VLDDGLDDERHNERNPVPHETLGDYFDEVGALLREEPQDQETGGNGHAEACDQHEDQGRGRLLV
jgi:hypothetical protein